MVDTVGETDTVCPLLMPTRLNVDAPSLYVTLNGPLPVSEKVRVEDAPLQIATGEAATDAVGAGFTVTVAVPEPVWEHPKESVTLPLRE